MLKYNYYIFESKYDENKCKEMINNYVFMNIYKIMDKKYNINLKILIKIEKNIFYVTKSSKIKQIQYLNQINYNLNIILNSNIKNYKSISIINFKVLIEQFQSIFIDYFTQEFSKNIVQVLDTVDNTNLKWIGVYFFNKYIIKQQFLKKLVCQSKGKLIL